MYEYVTYVQIWQPITENTRRRERITVVILDIYLIKLRIGGAMYLSILFLSMTRISTSRLLAMPRIGKP